MSDPSPNYPWLPSQPLYEPSQSAAAMQNRHYEDTIFRMRREEERLRRELMRYEQKLDATRSAAFRQAAAQVEEHARAANNPGLGVRIAAVLRQMADE